MESSPTLEGAVPISRPPDFEGRKQTREITFYPGDDTFSIDYMTDGYSSIPRNHPVYIEVSAKPAGPNTLAQESEVVWKRSGAWESSSHWNASLAGSLWDHGLGQYMASNLPSSVDRNGFKIVSSVAPLGEMQLVEFRMVSLAGKVQELEQKAKNQQAKIETMEQQAAHQKAKIETMDQKAEDQRAKIEAMEREMSKLKAKVEECDTMDSKLLHHVFQEHILQAAKNH